MKKILSMLLIAVFLVALAVPALAAPSMKMSASTLYLHPGENGFVSIPVKGAGSHDKDEFWIQMTKNESSNVNIAYLNNWSEENMKLEIEAVAPGKATIALGFTVFYAPKYDEKGVFVEYTKEKSFSFKLKVVAEYNFAPKLVWSQVEMNSESGFPQLKIRMTDDYGLMTVCFVRSWASEGGAPQKEIYDIISLYDDTDRIVFRTLDKPGEYSLQINDNYAQEVAGGKTARTNTKVLIVLVDTDGDGVADAYYTDDPAVLTHFGTTKAAS